MFQKGNPCYKSSTCIALRVVRRGYYRDGTPCIMCNAMCRAEWGLCGGVFVDFEFAKVENFHPYNLVIRFMARLFRPNKFLTLVYTAYKTGHSSDAITPFNRNVNLSSFYATNFKGKSKNSTFLYVCTMRVYFQPYRSTPP